MLHQQCNPAMIRNPWENGVKRITINITNKKLNLLFDGIEAKAPSFVTNVNIEGKTVPLHTFDFNNWLTLKRNNSYVIIFEDYHTKDKRVFRLPEEMNKNLFHFLTGGRRWGDNCRDFVNAMLFGCGNNELQMIYLNRAESEIIKNDNNLAIGQAVAIGAGLATEELCHFAICLGNGLYMSVLGDNNPIYITTLEQMKMIYGVNTAVKVTPVSVPLAKNNICSVQ